MHQGTHRLSSSVSLLWSESFAEYRGLRSFADGASATPFSLSDDAGPVPFFVERTGIIASVFCSPHRTPFSTGSQGKSARTSSNAPSRDPQTS